MRGFIEVTTEHHKIIVINVRHIISFSAYRVGSSVELTGESFNDGYINLKESYDELKRLIEEATQ